jgi:hypothetical protein
VASHCEATSAQQQQCNQQCGSLRSTPLACERERRQCGSLRSAPPSCNIEHHCGSLRSARMFIPGAR